MRKVFLIMLTVLLGAALVSGCVAKGKYDDELKAYDKLKADSDQALADCGKKLLVCEAIAVDLGKKLIVTEQKAKYLEVIAIGLKAETEIEALEILYLADRITLRLKESVLFDSGSAVVHAKGKEILKKVAGVLKGINDRLFMIEGHTDNVPVGAKSAFKDNWDLSWYRAKDVLEILGKNGVDLGKMGASGFASYQPVAPNATDANKAKNRRIEIEIFSPDQLLPGKRP